MLTPGRRKELSELEAMRIAVDETKQLLSGDYRSLERYIRQGLRWSGGSGRPIVEASSDMPGILNPAFERYKTELEKRYQSLRR
jgi:hypothetical protein|tara:strand:- start:20320 stop:20571 length:252 start_codon:yes stop_codon:yes gene_type:complete